MSSQTGKDVIYIDIDDEITAVIDKVRGAQHRIVALVLPKRAAVFQSVVNMKLLKRTADSSKRQLVLITSEAGLLPLAGAVGVYVAKTLQSKPEIPNSPTMGRNFDADEEDISMAEDAKLDKTRPIGEYARNAGGAGVGSLADNEEDEAVMFDNTAPAAVSAGNAKKTNDKKGKNKKLQIPDFNKFRIWIMLGGVGLVALIFLWYVAASVMPRANVAVKTDSSAVNSTFSVTFDATAKAVNVETDVIPAKVQQTQKTATQQVAATGQKDNGTKATGEVVIKNCSPNVVTVPSGTAVTAGGLVFVTQQRVDLDRPLGPCKSTGDHIGSVTVVAHQAGQQYNVDARSDYTVSGFSSSVTASGSVMTGGTSSIVKVISQADIDGAKQKIIEQDSNAVKLELTKALQTEGYYAVVDTFTGADPAITTTANVGDEAENVTVTAKITYTMLGAKENDLKKLIANEVNQKIDPQKQTILDYGLTEATFRLQNQQGAKSLVDLSVTSIAGSDMDLTDVKKQIAGKKANEAKEIINKYPGVTDVDVHYSPFWVSSIPKNTSKITLTVEKPSSQNAQ